MFGKTPGKRKINSKSTPTSRRQTKKRLEQKKTQFADRTLVFTVYDDGSFDIHVQGNKKICLKDQWDRETAVGALVLEHPDFFKVKSVQKVGKKKKKQKQLPKHANKQIKNKAPKKTTKWSKPKPKKPTKVEIARLKKEEEERKKWELRDEVLEVFYSSCCAVERFIRYADEDIDDYYSNRSFKFFEDQMKWYEKQLNQQLMNAKLTEKNKKKYKVLAKQYADMIY